MTLNVSRIRRFWIALFGNIVDPIMTRVIIEIDLCIICYFTMKGCDDNTMCGKTQLIYWVYSEIELPSIYLCWSIDNTSNYCVSTIYKWQHCKFLNTTGSKQSTCIYVPVNLTFKPNRHQITFIIYLNIFKSGLVALMVS